MKSLREQVAEVEGWTNIHWHRGTSGESPDILFGTPPQGGINNWVVSSFDTSSDPILAAIRRRFVTEEQKHAFVTELISVIEQDKLASIEKVNGDADYKFWQASLFDTATATTEQLCRAFVAAATSTAA